MRFGHYARVLVDINLTVELHDQILVEREDFAFFVNIAYENLPHFCTHIKIIGHTILNWEMLASSVEAHGDTSGKALVAVQQKINKRTILWLRRPLPPSPLGVVQLHVLDSFSSSFSPIVGTQVNEIDLIQLVSVAAANVLRVVSRFLADLIEECSNEESPNPEETAPLADLDFKVVLSKSQNKKIEAKGIIS